MGFVSNPSNPLIVRIGACARDSDLRTPQNPLEGTDAAGRYQYDVVVHHPHGRLRFRGDHRLKSFRQLKVSLLVLDVRWDKYSGFHDVMERREARVGARRLKHAKLIGRLVWSNHVLSI